MEVSGGNWGGGNAVRREDRRKEGGVRGRWVARNDSSGFRRTRGRRGRRKEDVLSF